MAHSHQATAALAFAFPKWRKIPSKLLNARAFTKLALLRPEVFTDSFCRQGFNCILYIVAHLISLFDCCPSLAEMVTVPVPHALGTQRNSRETGCRSISMLTTILSCKALIVIKRCMRRLSSNYLML